MRKGWIETTLEGIAHFLNGYPFKPSELGENGIPVIRIKQLLDPMEPVDKSLATVPEKNHLQNGDIIFSWSGTLAVRIWDRGNAYLNQHLFKVVEKKGVVREFLPLVIEHAIDDLVAKSHGTTMKHITKQTLLPHKILLPPLPEQKRIIDLISSVDSYIDALAQHAESARISRNALLHEILSAGGGGWTETTLGDVVLVINGGTPSTKKPEYWDGDITWITTTELTQFDGKVIGSSARTLTELGLKEGPAKLVNKGSILLGTTATIGTVGFVEKPVAFNQQISGIQVLDSEINPMFIFFYLQSLKHILVNLSAGTSFKRISTTVLKNVEISIPPLSEQMKIVELISAMDEEIFAAELLILQAKKLRSGLLSDLLSGDHEIPESYDKIMSIAR